MSRNPFKAIMNEDIKRFESYSEGIGAAIQRSILQSNAVTNPFKLVMQKQVVDFAPHSERIREAIERELSQSALVTNPFKLVQNEQQEVIAPFAENMKSAIASRLSSSVALGDMVSSYLKISLESFFTFNATILEGIGAQMRLGTGKALAAVTVKVYEHMAAHRLMTGEQVSPLDIDGIFNAYKPIDLIFDMPFDERHVRELLPQKLALMFRRVGITEFRIVKIKNDGVKLQLEIPEENAAHFITSFELGTLSDLQLTAMEVSEEYEEVFPLPFEHEVKQVIKQIEDLLDARKLQEALERCLSFFSSYRLLRPQSQVFMLQGNYAYVQNNRGALSPAVIAVEEDRITYTLRQLLNSLG